MDVLSPADFQTDSGLSSVGSAINAAVVDDRTGKLTNRCWTGRALKYPNEGVDGKRQEEGFRADGDVDVVPHR